MATSALVTTAGSASANAYCTVAVADQYHDNKPSHGTAWFDSGEKDAAILWATAQLDALILWSGARTDTTQALEWPRTGLVYPSGVAVASTVIPVQVQHATAEFAAALVSTDRVGDGAAAKYGITELDVPGIKLKFGTTPATTRAVPAAVTFLLPDDWSMVRRGIRAIARA